MSTLTATRPKKKEKEKKSSPTLDYLSYILRHKWFVFIAGLLTRAPFWRLLIHDWSKFLPSEWVPYRNYFYPDMSPHPLGNPVYNGPSDTQRRYYETVRKAAFAVAWLHHQRRNKHHWQYWILVNDNPDETTTMTDFEGRLVTYRLLTDTLAQPMPDKYIREMVADWAGAGRAITGRWEFKAWYEKNRDKIILHSETRRRVEMLIDELDGRHKIFLTAFF